MECLAGLRVAAHSGATCDLLEGEPASNGKLLLSGSHNIGYDVQEGVEAVAGILIGYLGASCHCSDQIALVHRPSPLLAIGWANPLLGQMTRFTVLAPMSSISAFRRPHVAFHSGHFAVLADGPANHKSRSGSLTRCYVWPRGAKQRSENSVESFPKL